MNWFSKKNIAYVLSVFAWSQALGYITWVNHNSENNGVKFTIAGVLFLLVAIFDYFFFYYTPSQANIFIGDSTRSREDRMKFDAYKQSLVSNGMSVF
jgi:hypothetical protein